MNDAPNPSNITTWIGLIAFLAYIIVEKGYPWFRKLTDRRSEEDKTRAEAAEKGWAAVITDLRLQLTEVKGNLGGVSGKLDSVEAAERDCQIARAKLEVEVLQLRQHLGEVKAVVLSDATGRIVQWDHDAERLFGWTAKEVLGQSLEIMLPMRFRDAHARAFTNRVASEPGRHVGTEIVRDSIAVTKSGAEIPVKIALRETVAGGQRLFSATIKYASSVG